MNGCPNSVLAHSLIFKIHIKSNSEMTGKIIGESFMVVEYG